MNYAIILAGGTGTRAGGPLPKQFQEIRGRRMLWWSVDAFRRFDPDCRIILVVHPDFIGCLKDFLVGEADGFEMGIDIVPGGSSRIESVRNGLDFIDGCLEKESLAGEDIQVFIHDAARPFVTTDLIERGSKAVKSEFGAVPAIPVTDSIRMITPTGSRAVDRSDFVAVQTPQVFMFHDIKSAYDSVKEESGLTDDASVAERAGLNIVLFDGDPANKKITNPSDFGN